MKAEATHLRAGDIIAKRDTTANPNPRRFFFKMVIYKDMGSIQEDPEVIISNGDGSTQLVKRFSIRSIGNETEREVFYWEHTYPAEGSYVISCNIEERNAGILNIAPPTDQVSFFISTTININVFHGFNSTPVFTVAPIDLAAVGRPYVHNPGAYDPDGDSLVFKMRVPQQVNAAGRVDNVPGYKLPHLVTSCQNSDASGTSYLRLDQNTGQLEWNAPCLKGEYNLAFVVEEWRVAPNGGAVKLGEVVRDMQIIVKETQNRPPVLQPKDTCIVAGTTLTGTVRATDPDGDLITLTAAGSGIIPPAIFTVTSSTPGASTGSLVWNTTCEDVREAPYQVVFRAEDVRPETDTRLADLQPWNIRVVGPPPQNLTATSSSGNVTLSWDKYTCQNASVIRIYRREGASGFVPDECQTGVPASTGYVLIGEVSKDKTSFTDNNGGAGLPAGADYCYIIYAEFPTPGRGASLASEEVCVVTDQDIPYLTHVTVDQTDAANGQITVRWTQPRQVEQLSLPLEYRLLRRLAREEGSTFVEVKRTRNMADTTWVDSDQNTNDQSYRYRLELYQSSPAEAQPTKLHSSTEASSVWLEVNPASGDEKALELNWHYDVPWKNEVLRHYIYRKIDGTFTLIDSVMATANQGTYTDKGTFAGLGLNRGQNYCYYVQTVGTYQLSATPSPLLNNSQEACAVLPKLLCAPELRLENIDCEAFLQTATGPPYQHVLHWSPNLSPDCTEDIAYYTVYYKATIDGAFVPLGTTTETTFTHVGLNSYAGCYVVTATDTQGRESSYSNEVCQDNCIFFMLPNIITPNSDGLNDEFKPDKKTRFIRSMKFKVFNRWGVKVYELNGSNSDELYINWEGVDSKGNRLPDGIYYYEVEVGFYTLDPAKENRTYKGWVEILR
ncbi:gliding motility-associated C-terminal domain-containing protein [Pontibacter korlensis]